jgi:prolyl oligopeptidase
VSEQYEATSKAGTHIPYFSMHRKDWKLDGTNPTLLYGYGGFEISLTPHYSASRGTDWLAKGGVYVIANIRGGGEFGPKWHQSAMLKNKLKSYEDFIAVAEDLIQRKITSKAKLGIQGGSNGGLLVGAVTMLRPDLFNAVICQAPLLDMKRYTKLLAGASWAAEYGDPDDPDMWNYIKKYSPYQNVKDDVTYPEIFFTTSTRDDRVHPGHARKMVARMKEQGHRVLYFENTEGGHSGAANNKQRAHVAALTYAYLYMKLMN